MKTTANTDTKTTAMIGEIEATIENGHVRKGLCYTTTGRTATPQAVHPYRWNAQLRSWVIDQSSTPDAIRAGIRRGTICWM